MTKIVSEKVLMTKELSFVKRSIGRVFLSMLILFLSISNVAVPVYGETVTTEESYSETSYTYNNFSYTIDIINTNQFESDYVSTPGVDTYDNIRAPIVITAKFPNNKTAYHGLVPEKCRINYYSDNILTGRSDVPANIAAGKTYTSNTSSDDLLAIFDRPGVLQRNTVTQVKLDNFYSDVTINSINKGTRVCRYNMNRNGDDTTFTVEKTEYTINLTLRMYVKGTDNSNVDLIKETRTIKWIPEGSAFRKPGRVGQTTYTLVSGTIPTIPPQRDITTIKSGESFTIVKDYVAALTDYHDPVASDTSFNALIKTAGDTPNWTEGISATWGKTTANVIRPDSTATTDGGGDGMGTITDMTLSGGTDVDLSTDGSTFDKIGVKEHEYLIKDAHSLSSEAQYSGDDTSATVKRNIIVKTEAVPALTAYYKGTDDLYGGEWLSQYEPTNPAEGPDAAHFKKVDLKASGSSIEGTYDTVIWEKGAPEGSDSEAARGTNTNSAIHTYGTETGADGTSFYANLQEANNGTIANNAGLTALSGNTDSVTVKIDSTPPTANVSVSDDWHEGLTFADSSSDALSGIDKVYIALVAPDSTAPTIGDNSWQELGSSGTVNYTPGEKYDIYAYAVDKATNKSSVKLLESGRDTIRRHYTVSYESNGGTSVAPEQVYEGKKATEPANPTRPDYHFVGWYQEEGLTNPFNFDTPIMNNTKLYAKWVDDKNGNGVDDNTEFRTIKYTDGVDDEEVFADVVYANALDGLSTPAFDPADPDNEPTRRFFVFDGWAPQVAGVVNGDATYTARWAVDNNEDGVPDDEHPYTVTFDSDGKDWVNGPAPQTGILYGEKVSRPSPDPSAENYVFDGWYKENTFNNAWDFDSDVVHHDLTIYAKWLDDFNNSGINDEDEYVIVKYVDGVDDEDLFEDQVYEKQLPGNAPPEFRGVPSREYYLFGGWDPEVPSVIPDVPKDTVITYTATWKEDRNDNGIADEDEPYEYFYSEGDGNVWQKGSGLSSDFTVKRSLFDEDAFAHFTNGGHGIQVDGVTVDASDYTATEGSVKLSLKPAYLETLSVGEHKLTTLFDDGEATAAFFVKTKNEDLGGSGSGDDSGTVPGGSGDGNSSNGQDDAKSGKTARGSSAKTGDESVLYGWLTAMLIASIATAGMLYRRRSKG